MLVTALNRKIGYDNAAKIAKTAHKNGTHAARDGHRAGPADRRGVRRRGEARADGRPAEAQALVFSRHPPRKGEVGSGGYWLRQARGATGCYPAARASPLEGELAVAANAARVLCETDVVASTSATSAWPADRARNDRVSQPAPLMHHGIPQRISCARTLSTCRPASRAPSVSSRSSSRPLRSLCGCRAIWHGPLTREQGELNLVEHVYVPPAGAAPRRTGPFIPPLLIVSFLIYNLVAFIFFGGNPAGWSNTAFSHPHGLGRAMGGFHGRPAGGRLADPAVLSNCSSPPASARCRSSSTCSRWWSSC